MSREFPRRIPHTPDRERSNSYMDRDLLWPRLSNTDPRWSGHEPSLQWGGTTRINRDVTLQWLEHIEHLGQFEFFFVAVWKPAPIFPGPDQT